MDAMPRDIRCRVLIYELRSSLVTLLPVIAAKTRQLITRLHNDDMRCCVCEVLSPETGKCRTQKPLTVVKSGYIAGAVGSAAGSVSSSDADAEDADRCSTLILDTLLWKSIRISLIGLYSRSQLFGYCTDPNFVIVTSAKELMFSSLFVCLFVC